MKKEHMKNFIIFIAAVAVIIAACFVSFDKFGTFNFIKGGIGFARIALTDTDYVEIQKSPRIVLTENAEVFFDRIEDEGYEYIEHNQMGSSHTIEKDGKTELVISHNNGYFTRWTWNK